MEWKNDTVVTIDQTRLPHRLVYLKLQSCRDVALAVKTMKIRGAPLIGAAGAYALALTAVHSKASTRRKLLEELKESAKIIQATRPTGVNLFWAVERILNRVAQSQSPSADELRNLVVREAQKIADEDVRANRKMGEFGSKLIADGNTVLTHCNAGALATVDFGTALGVIRSAWEQGKRISVIATETRPRLQGARLTAYELKALGIPFKLITDNMVGYVMSGKMVDVVIVGADRIVRDAVANKIGTYSIAVLAHEHEIPFYVAAPISTFDLNQTAKDIHIEERTPDEVTKIGARRFAPRGTIALNPAFDITPMKYITRIICEKGVFTPRELQKLA